MYIVITVSLIAILLTYWDVQKVISNGMMYAFCLLAILYGLHYDYGTDYMQYLYEYENVGMNDRLYTLLEKCDLIKCILHKSQIGNIENT